MREYVAAIDQGTTGTRCILFDLEGRPAAAVYREHRQIFPQPGWVGWRFLSSNPLIST